MRISEGHPPLKYARPRGGFNAIRTAGRNEFGLGKVCRRVSGSLCGENNFTRRLEPAPQRPPLPKPQSFGFCGRHSTDPALAPVVVAVGRPVCFFFCKGVTRRVLRVAKSKTTNKIQDRVEPRDWISATPGVC